MTAVRDRAPATPDAGGRRHLSVRIWSGYARGVVALRWFLIVGWVAAAAASALLLPPLGANGDDLEELGAGDASLAAEQRSSEIFGFPLLSRTALVQHDPDGMTPLAQAEAVARGIAVNQAAYDTEILGAVPVPNTTGAVPWSAQENTTVVTFLFLDPRLPFFQQHDQALAFAESELTDAEDSYVGVTGSVPARSAQADVLEARVHLIEGATLLAVLVVVALTFRSWAAPLVTLVAVGAAVGVTLGVSGSLSEMLGISVPADLRPLIVALILGVVTDYCIFYLSGLRSRLALGEGRLEAARKATAEVTPIVVVAGLTVAAGTASLIVARSALFRGFGPGLALTVLIGVLVAMTLVPALLAVSGRWAFYPHDPALEPERFAPRARPTRLTSALTRRSSAALIAVGSIGLLVFAALPLPQLDLGLGFVQSLPEENPTAAAAKAASDGFAEGIVSPTELLLVGDGVGTQTDALLRLDEAIEGQPGIAGVVGPGESPVADELGILVSEDGNAARYLVVLENSPLESTAIEHLRDLRAELPALTQGAGLGEPEIGIAGDTALAGSIVEDTTDDLLRIGIAAVVANLLMLMLFLRAVVAPLYLLACSLLALAASLGVTVTVFQTWLGHDDITFYVPFAAAVLLLSLGSDYNIFAVGKVWQLARNRSLGHALTVGVPQSTRAITSAGLALASTFGILALIPLRPFRELGLTLAVGILIDVFLVRALLVPSLLTLVGPASSWPSKRLKDPSSREAVAAQRT